MRTDGGFVGRRLENAPPPPFTVKDRPTRALVNASAWLQAGGGGIEVRNFSQFSAISQFFAILRNFSQFFRNFSAIFRNWIRPPQTAIPPPPLLQEEQSQLEAMQSELQDLHALKEREQQLQMQLQSQEQRCRQLEEEAEGHMSILSAKQEADAEARKQFLALQEELSAAKKSLQVWLRVGVVRSYTKGRRGWGWWGASRGSGRRRRKA